MNMLIKIPIDQVAQTEQVSTDKISSSKQVEQANHEASTKIENEAGTNGKSSDIDDFGPANQQGIMSTNQDNLNNKIKKENSQSAHSIEQDFKGDVQANNQSVKDHTQADIEKLQHDKSINDKQVLQQNINDNAHIVQEQANVEQARLEQAVSSTGISNQNGQDLTMTKGSIVKPINPTIINRDSLADNSQQQAQLSSSDLSENSASSNLADPMERNINQDGTLQQKLNIDQVQGKTMPNVIGQLETRLNSQG